ncbi:MAG: hypothetical protein FJW20_19265 [Acidimicrobiia bacterium]|nr:hypothetical protein [Acidimicrobiia bacterium]
MYNRELVAKKGAQLILECGEQRHSVPVYSQEGLEMVAGLWTKLSTQYRLMYEPTWMGIPIIQTPGDVLMMQELIWRLRPDFIVECGLAHGGSAVCYASVCELAGKGRVIGVDVEVRQYNRVALRSHPMAHRIELIEASSVELSTVAEVERRVAGSKTVMVVLDSNHSHQHVRKELELYHRLVTPGSYLVVMDGAQAHVWDIPSGKPEWKDDHPLKAIREFLDEHREFCPDDYYTRLHVTSCPDGFLRRRPAGEVSS